MKSFLEYHDIHGGGSISSSSGLLEFYFQTGLKKFDGQAIINRTQKEAKKHEIVRDLDQTFHKIDGITL